MRLATSYSRPCVVPGSPMMDAQGGAGQSGFGRENRSGAGSDLVQAQGEARLLEDGGVVAQRPAGPVRSRHAAPAPGGEGEEPGEGGKGEGHQECPPPPQPRGQPSEQDAEEVRDEHDRDPPPHRLAARVRGVPHQEVPLEERAQGQERLERRRDMTCAWGWMGQYRSCVEVRPLGASRWG